MWKEDIYTFPPRPIDDTRPLNKLPRGEPIAIFCLSMKSLTSLHFGRRVIRFDILPVSLATLNKWRLATGCDIMIQCVGSYAHHISVLARVALMKIVQR